MRYQLYYWPSIQGRGEFVRLALEEACADYDDVGRKHGFGAIAKKMRQGDRSPFAPPFLQAGRQIVAQTANVLFFLGPRLGLAPRSETGRLWAHQLQLTVSDLVDEIHDTHHPISSSLYYEEQKKAAKQASELFLSDRLPAFLDYFDSVLNDSSGNFITGRTLSYVDLSLFQIIDGLRYAFPNAMKQRESDWPGLVDLHGRVAARPNIAAYLESPRRIPFNEDGIFRHYPELDIS